MTSRAGALERKRVAFGWTKVPDEARPGAVVIGTGFATREYQVRLTPEGVDLEWDDGRDGRAYSVWREFDGAWACSCPDAFARPDGKCKHQVAVMDLFNREGW